MNSNVFNESGDFITSPEISQLFSEMIGIWIQNTWEVNHISNKDKKSIIEFGPGTGKLSKSILQTISQFGSLSNFELNYVEVSPFLRKLQQTTLCDFMAEKGIYLLLKNIDNLEILESKDKDVKFIWHSSFENFTNYTMNNSLAQNSIFLGHEFIDALPAHKFKYSNGSWKELLIDYITSKDTPLLVSPYNSNNSSKIKNSFSVVESDSSHMSIDKVLNPNVRFKDIKIDENQEIEISPMSLLKRSIIWYGYI